MITGGVTDNNITSPKRQPVNVLTSAYSVNASSLTQITLSHSTGSIPLVTCTTGISNVNAWPFTVTSTQIFIGIYNYLTSAQSGTLTVNFW